MADKEPVLLVVLIETAKLRWYVGGISLDGNGFALLCSEEGDLSSYVGQDFDQQLNFLRHRLSGVLQRGCDRLWGRNLKPCQIVFLADGKFIDAHDELTQRVGDHFVAWMSQPPVVFFLAENAIDEGTAPAPIKLAGDLDASYQSSLDNGLDSLLSATQNSSRWELVPKKKTTQ